MKSMADPYTIRICVPDGDPEGVRIVDRMNWTGVGIAFPSERSVGLTLEANLVG